MAAWRKCGLLLLHKCCQVFGWPAFAAARLSAAGMSMPSALPLPLFLAAVTMVFIPEFSVEFWKPFPPRAFKMCSPRFSNNSQSRDRRQKAQFYQRISLGAGPKIALASGGGGPSANMWRFEAWRTVRWDPNDRLERWDPENIMWELG